MVEGFDPYRIWLGIPPAEQPAHHYRLLGIGLFESNLDVIEGAADRQMAHVQKHKIGQHSADSQRLLNELAKAKLTLMNAAKSNAGTVTAKKGYAVGGVKVSTSSYVSGLDVAFMKVDRGMLDSKDQYVSPRIGSNLNFGNHKTIGGDGQPAIGIFGFANDYHVYGLGLVQLSGQ
jgi:hypothetical protein